MWSVRQLIAEGEILPFLQSDWRYAAYAIADLEPWFFEQCRWWLAEDSEVGERRLESDGPQGVETNPVRGWGLLLLFDGLEPPAVFAQGDPDGVAALLDQVVLPDRVYFTARPQHWPLVEERCCLEFANRMMRMALAAEDFRASSSDAVRRLGTADLGAVQTLYRLGKSGDADGFAPFQVERGVFFGSSEDGRLVSVAGTHVVSLRHGLAAVGNVFTHPAFRGRGHALACTSAVTANLLEQGLNVVLNVAVRNKAAASLYRRLGYRTYCRFFEGVGASKRSTARS